jgi:2-polyprenyl-3-methyl-5-hydroxy-6-metoxy-1,4-benzoquinol methylase
MTPAEYWEGRAQRFATEREGLAAVCSYGMPEFYNRSIQYCQRRALGPWLRVARGATALDVGCGVGRWSRMLARQGAQVTGVDLSPTMLHEAGRRAKAEGLDDRCHFVVSDIAQLDTGERYELVVGVTVLQHVLDDDALVRSVRNLKRHLAPWGRMVLLEAAPTRRIRRCDTPIFKARDMESYLAAFAAAGLSVVATTGVDPAPFKTWLLPHYRKLPRPYADIALAAVTAAAFPIDALLGRVLTRASWHKVFVLEHGCDQQA